MSWGSLLVYALQLLVSILSWMNAKKLIKAGEDAAIARASLEVLEATNEGKRLHSLIQGLSDDEADDLWQRMLRNDPPE